MNAVRNCKLAPLGALGLALVLLSGCATTPKIDWSSRIGTYTYEQAVVELGPPDKHATLSDGTLVAEWLLHRGYTQAYAPLHGGWHGYGPWFYGPMYPAYIDTYTSPDSFLRLIFDPHGLLKDWKRYYK